MRRHVHGFIDSTLDLLERSDVQLLARIYVKSPGGPFDGKAVYTASVQAICEGFQRHLDDSDAMGFVVADSRTPSLNSLVSHSIFTRKFQSRGDPYSRISEMPVFGHSENHAMIQIADIVASTLLFPIASYTYCAGHIANAHVHPGDERIRERYALRLKNLGYRYESGGKYKGGITVADSITKCSPAKMFVGLS